MNAASEQGDGAAFSDSASSNEDLMQVLRDALGSLREVVARWFVLAELEARDAALRVIMALAMAVATVIVVAAAWIFAVSAGVALLVSAGASLALSLLVAAGLNLLLAAGALWVLWRNLRNPWFLATRRQIGLSVDRSEEKNDAQITH